MEQKDFILRKIEKIGILLRYLLGKLIYSKSLVEQKNSVEFINCELQEKFGKNLDSILQLSINDFESVFTKNKGFNFENIELFADLLYTLGNDSHKINKKYLLKALELYTYIDKESKTYSFERVSKIKRLKELLDQ